MSYYLSIINPSAIEVMSNSNRLAKYENSVINNPLWHSKHKFFFCETQEQKDIFLNI